MDSALSDLKIASHAREEVAYHCKLLFDAGLISSYDSHSADNHLYMFSVGPLTWEGHNFLDNIREDTTWNKTKKTIREKTLPMTLEVIREISKAIASAAVNVAIAGI